MLDDGCRYIAIAAVLTVDADEYLLEPFTRDVVFAKLQILGMTQT